MANKIVIYCPDKHISYNIFTLNQIGVGGGITARVRIAHALARRGHKVHLYVNCPLNGIIEGVNYFHFSEYRKVDADIFIASTSGDGLDLSSISGSKINARIKILLLHGDAKPKGYENTYFDFIYSPSNYINQKVTTNWRLPENRLFVTHRGIEDDLFNQEREHPPIRDQHRLIYAGHPSKGMDTAIALLRILQGHDPYFSLHIFGGNQLWGQPQEKRVDEPGVFFHGLIGQKNLALQMQKSSFSINLQSREEPFGMVVTESMRAGCIVLASSVGAYPELIQNDRNGFLIPGVHTHPATINLAAETILASMKDPKHISWMRRNAIVAPIKWDIVARAWEGHWNWFLDPFREKILNQGFDYRHCPICKDRLLQLADGLHCYDCGNYLRI